MRAINVNAWLQTRLMPLLRNHAGRVTADTIRTGLEVAVAVADEQGERIGRRS